MATPAEIVQLVSQSVQPLITELSRQSEERLQRVIGEANEQIRRLEQRIADMNINQPRNDANRSMMDAKSFNKIDRFSAQHNKWRSFRTQVENMSESVYPRVGRKLLKWARGLGYQEIVLQEDDEFNHDPPEGITHEATNRISQDLAATLSYLLEGESESILNNAGDGNGLDAWRKLQQRFDPKSNARDLVDTQKIIRPPQCKSLNDVLPALEKWEEAVRNMNETNRPNEMMKMGIAIGMCPPKLIEHLQNMEDRITSYGQLRAEIVRKIDLAEVNKQHIKHDTKDDHMDIGRLDNQNEQSDNRESNHTDDQWDSWTWTIDWSSPWSGEVDLQSMQPWGQWGKAKGKGKGKKGFSPKGSSKGSKGKEGKKGDGKGKGYASSTPWQGKGFPKEFQGYCSYCWEWGHTAKYCPRKQQDAHAIEAHPSQSESVEKEQDAMPISALERTGQTFEWQFCHPCGGHPQQSEWREVIYPKRHDKYGNEKQKNEKYQVKNMSDMNEQDTVSKPYHSWRRQAVIGRRYDPLMNPAAITNRYDPLVNEMDDDNDLIIMGLERVSPAGQVQVSAVTPKSRRSREYDKTGKYVKLTCTGDSGAGESVLPREWFPEVPAQRSEEETTSYAAADGTLLPNEGKKVLMGYNESGKRVQMQWQLADITKPLVSLGRLTDRGHRIVLDNAEAGGGYMEYKATGEKTRLRKERGVYEFDVWVELPGRADHATRQMSSFRRQG